MDRFFYKFCKYLGAIVLIYFVISCYASYSGVPLIKHEHYYYDSINIYYRDIFNIFGFSLSGILGLKTVFQGLLDHHQTYGMLLVITNFYFLYAYGKYREKIFLFFLIINILSVLGSTNRFAMIALFVSISYFFLRQSRKSKLVSLSYFASLVIVILLNLRGLYNVILKNFHNYVNTTSTFHYRVAVWSYYSSQINFNRIFTFLFGYDRALLSRIALSSPIGRSMESEFLQIILTFGFVGLVLFINLFYSLLKKRNDRLNMVTLQALGIACLISFIFVGLFLKYTVFALFTILYHYILIKDKEQTTNNMLPKGKAHDKK